MLTDHALQRGGGQRSQERWLITWPHVYICCEKHSPASHVGHVGARSLHTTVDKRKVGEADGFKDEKEGQSEGGSGLKGPCDGSLSSPPDWGGNGNAGVEAALSLWVRLSIITVKWHIPTAHRQAARGQRCGFRLSQQVSAMFANVCLPAEAGIQNGGMGRNQQSLQIPTWSPIKCHTVSAAGRKVKVLNSSRSQKACNLPQTSQSQLVLAKLYFLYSSTGYSGYSF